MTDKIPIIIAIILFNDNLSVPKAIDKINSKNTLISCIIAFITAASFTYPIV